MPATFLNTFQRRAHGAGLPTNLSTAGSRRILIARRFGRSSQLHEDSVIQQYYIATKSSPADDRARGLKYGTLFSVFDHLGDIRTSGLGEQALFQGELRAGGVAGRTVRDVQALAARAAFQVSMAWRLL